MDGFMYIQRLSAQRDDISHDSIRHAHSLSKLCDRVNVGDLLPCSTLTCFDWFSTIMNPNTHRMDSGSHINNGYSADPGSFANQFNKMNGLQGQQQPWSPQSPGFPPSFPPSASRIQSNGWPQQQQQQPMPQIQIPNGSMPPTVPMQPLVSPINAMASNNTNSLGLLPANILQDVFRLSVPVGTSSNDDTLLVQVLKESVQRGQTYKQAIETLHGVRDILLGHSFVAEIIVDK